MRAASSAIPRPAFARIEFPRIGLPVEDDPETQVFFGCLIPRPGRNESVRVLNFGQIDPVDKIKQTEVQARYVMELTEE